MADPLHDALVLRIFPVRSIFMIACNYAIMLWAVCYSVQFVMIMGGVIWNPWWTMFIMGVWGGILAILLLIAMLSYHSVIKEYEAKNKTMAASPSHIHVIQSYVFWTFFLMVLTIVLHVIYIAVRTNIDWLATSSAIEAEWSDTEYVSYLIMFAACAFWSLDTVYFVSVGSGALASPIGIAIMDFEHSSEVDKQYKKMKQIQK